MCHVVDGVIYDIGNLGDDQFVDGNDYVDLDDGHVDDNVDDSNGYDGVDDVDVDDHGADDDENDFVNGDGADDFDDDDVGDDVGDVGDARINAENVNWSSWWRS